MAQLVTPNQRTPHCRCNTSTGEDGARPRKPTGQITSKLGVLLGSQFARPKILAAGIGKGTREFTQRDADARGDDADQDDSVHDEKGTAGTDSRDQGRRNAKPGIGQGEADAQDGQDRVVAPHLLRVAHLGQLEGILIEGARGGAGGFALGDDAVGDFFHVAGFSHGGGRGLMKEKRVETEMGRSLDGGEEDEGRVVQDCPKRETTWLGRVTRGGGKTWRRKEQAVGSKEASSAGTLPISKWLGSIEQKRLEKLQVQDGSDCEQRPRARIATSMYLAI